MSQKLPADCDNLKVDPELVVNCRSGQMKQKWTIVSFISPEDRIKQRFFYEANRFLYYDVNKQIVDTTINLTKNINSELINLLDQKIQSYQSSNEESYHIAMKILQQTRQD